MNRKIVIEWKEEDVGDWNLETFLVEEKAPKKIGTCSICFSEVESGPGVFECPYCGNLAHVKCLQLWVESRGSCPICKRPLSLDDLKTSEGSS